MISPLQIIQQIQEDQAPTNWLIFRPNRLTSPIMGIVLGSFGGIFTMIFGTLFVTAIIQPTLLNQSNVTLFGQLAITIPMVLLSLTISAVISLRLMKQAKMKGDSVLILLPEGVVSCAYINDDVKRSYHVIEYADIAYIRQNIEITSFRRTQLDLQYKSGKWERWRLMNIYGSHEWIAQRVIKDHLRFVKARSGTSPYKNKP